MIYTAIFDKHHSSVCLSRSLDNHFIGLKCIVHPSYLLPTPQALVRLQMQVNRGRLVHIPFDARRNVRHSAPPCPSARVPPPQGGTYLPEVQSARFHQTLPVRFLIRQIVLMNARA